MKNMKNFKKFSVLVGGKQVRIAPDYHNGGRGNGPIGWVCQADGNRTGVAVSVGRNWRVCQEHSLAWSDPLEEGTNLTGFQINGAAVSAVEWDRQLADECY
jgi:hypothetical protein